MTTALAAAMRELDRSREALEKELAGNDDFVALRRLESAGEAHDPAKAAEERKHLIARLEALPVYRALLSIGAGRAFLLGATPVVGQEAPSRGGSASHGVDERRQGAILAVHGPTSGRGVIAPRRFTPPAGPPQPLTAIRGLPLVIAQKLQAMGIQRYEQIAAWTAADVRHIATAFGLGREISRKNWIEQAAILAVRKDMPKAPSAQPGLQRATGPAASTPPAPPLALAGLEIAPSLANMAPAVIVEPSRKAPAIETEVIRRAVASAARAAIAHRTTDVRPVARPPSPPEPGVRRESNGARTFVTPSARLELDPVARIEKILEERPLRRPIVRPARSAAVAVSSAAKEKESVSVQPDDVRRVADDLQQIRGIDTVLADRLASAGAVSYGAIAGWEASDVTRMAGLLGLPRRRICREGWMEQAALLAAGGATQFSQCRTRGDFAALCPAPVAVANVELVRAVPVVVTHGETARSDAARGELIGAEAHGRVLQKKSLTQTLEACSEDTGEVEEATITLIARTPQVPPANSGHVLPQLPATVPRQAVFAPAARRKFDQSRWESTTLEPERPVKGINADHWTAPASTEEAFVEIIRKDDPVSPIANPTAAQVARARAAVRAMPPHNQLTVRQSEPQPVWISDKDAEAGGVMRRFLKALKRDA